MHSRPDRGGAGSRLDISAAREDITTADAEIDPWLQHVQRAAQVNREIWPLNDDGTTRRFASLPRCVQDDIAHDLETLLAWPTAHDLARAARASEVRGVRTLISPPRGNQDEFVEVGQSSANSWKTWRPLAGGFSLGAK
ncbi:MAG: hypothetical protein M3071_06630 [Actinomycetota bacterium]|nr:hypothetical protein [Actinomycetota bacterium]